MERGKNSKIKLARRLLRLPFSLHKRRIIARIYSVLNPVLKQCLILAFKILVPLLLCGGIGRVLYKSWGTIQEHHWNPDYLLLMLSGLCYIIAYIPAAIYWRYTMQTLGQHPGLYETFRAYYIGHLGKYVPGKVMVLIVRTGLLNHQRTKITAAMASVFVETMTMMAVGAFVAAVMALLLLKNIERNDITLLALGAMVGIMLPIFPPVFRFVTKRLKKYKIELEGLRFRTLMVGWLLNIPVWIMLGVSLWLTMLGLGMTSESILTELLYCTLAISCAMVFGFITMLPGGLGTREWAMAAILVPFFAANPIGGIDSVTMAAVIVTVLRFISVLSELAVSAVLVAIKR